MRKHLPLALATAAVVAFAAAPAAATLIPFNISGNGYTMNSGWLDCVINGDGSCTVDAISGNLNGGTGFFPIVALTTLGRNSTLADNTIFPGGLLSALGLSFQVDDGSVFGINYNLWYNKHFVLGDGSITSVFMLANDKGDPLLEGPGVPVVVTFGEIRAVPEPASWALMLGGFGLIGSAMRRQRVQVSFASA